MITRQIFGELFESFMQEFEGMTQKMEVMTQKLQDIALLVDQGLSEQDDKIQQLESLADPYSDSGEAICNSLSEQGQIND